MIPTPKKCCACNRAIDSAEIACELCKGLYPMPLLESSVTPGYYILGLDGFHFRFNTCTFRIGWVHLMMEPVAESFPDGIYVKADKILYAYETSVPLADSYPSMV